MKSFKKVLVVALCAVIVNSSLFSLGVVQVQDKVADVLAQQFSPDALAHVQKEMLEALAATQQLLDPSSEEDAPLLGEQGEQEIEAAKEPLVDLLALSRESSLREAKSKVDEAMDAVKRIADSFESRLSQEEPEVPQEAQVQEMPEMEEAQELEEPQAEEALPEEDSAEEFLPTEDEVDVTEMPEMPVPEESVEAMPEMPIPEEPVGTMPEMDQADVVADTTDVGVLVTDTTDIDTATEVPGVADITEEPVAALPEATELPAEESAATLLPEVVEEVAMPEVELPSAEEATEVPAVAEEDVAMPEVATEVPGVEIAEEPVMEIPAAIEPDATEVPAVIEVPEETTPEMELPDVAEVSSDDLGNLEVSLEGPGGTTAS